MFALKTNFPSPFDEFNNLNSLFDSRTARNGERQPPVDVIESDESFVVTTELPGVEEKAINIEFANNVLTISAERQITPNSAHISHRREISDGKFSRSMKFSTAIDSGNIAASYKNGMLEVSLPKDESLKPRKIEVSIA